MMQEKILYTDGHDVTVTDSTLQVRKHEYKLAGVTKCGMMVLRPRRAPGIIVLVIGLALIVAGVMQAIPSTMIPDMQMDGEIITANTLALWIGGALTLIGVLVLGLMRERYSLRIATAEGEKDAVISDKRAYIHQILDSINQAMGFAPRQVQVSHT